jgi:hypothetical protein
MKNFDCLRNFETFVLSKANLKEYFDFQVRVTDKKKAHFGPSFVMNRTDSASFRAGRIQLFHSAKMDSIMPLSAIFGNGRMGFSIRPAALPLGQNRQKWPTNLPPGNPDFPTQKFKYIAKYYKCIHLIQFNPEFLASLNIFSDVVLSESLTICIYN